MKSNTLAICLALLAIATVAEGHGTPIHVAASAGKLATSQGLLDPAGYAPMIYFEDDEDGEPLGALTLPGVGPVILWELPGLEIFGMNEQSNLSIEPLLRPVRDTHPIEQRLVWYWNPHTELVEPSSAAIHLLGTGQRFTTLAAEATIPPPPFLLADVMTGQQGFHNHSLLAYAVDNDPSAVPGAYGFFARLVSDSYEASDPFLVVFNHQVVYDDMLPAALAINAAAVDGLHGDYNHDGAVNAADYAVWRDTLGDTDSYDVWRDNFGDGLGGSAGSTAVPEPSALLLAAIVLAALACDSLRRSVGDRRSPAVAARRPTQSG